MIIWLFILTMCVVNKNNFNFRKSDLIDLRIAQPCRLYIQLSKRFKEKHGCTLSHIDLENVRFVFIERLTNAGNKPILHAISALN